MESPKEIHVIAAKRLFDDAIGRMIEKRAFFGGAEPLQAVQRAKRLEKISPAAAALLKDWIKQWNASCRGLTPEEVPDTDDEFD